MVLERSSDLYMIQPIVLYPNPILHHQCFHTPSKEELRSLEQDMRDTIQHYQALGIAAPQLGKLWTVFMIGGTLCINPITIRKSNSSCVEEESCLSIPGIRVAVERSATVTGKYTLVTGEEIEVKLVGLDARVWLHEMDHLDGVLIIDRGKALRS